MKYYYSAPALRGLSLLAAAVFISFFAAFPAPSRSQPFSIPPQAAECVRSLYRCGGDITNLYFPFWGGDTPAYCRHPGFELRCVNNEYSVMDYEGLEFRVLNVSQQSKTMTLARDDLWGDLCGLKIQNTTLNHSFFAYPTNLVANLTLLYGCSEIGDRSVDSFLNRFDCPGDGYDVVYMNDTLLESVREELKECKIVQVPVFRKALEEIERRVGSAGKEVINEELKKGFEVKYMDLASCYRCAGSGSNGSCGFDKDAEFECSCPKGSRSSSGGVCVPHKGVNWKMKVIIGIVCGVTVVMLLCITTCCFSRTRNSLVSQITKKDRDIEAFIKSNGSLTAAKRYRFSEVKKITKSFKDKLGQGGFGEVYKGKLQDGRLVAVKLLNLLKGNGEEFINEVASISRTSHVNIVTLLGFCLEGGKRALIYEFMPNGSLEKFAYNDDPSRTNLKLEWEKMIQIATGIARGLEYLHRGCNTRILHFDIKPHNILLDEDLCPKISDFGLAKLCPNKQSNISLLDARGTIGYIAPEVFNRNFGEVSSKSDVYSYGMMVLEMVGGRKNINVGVSRTSEIYFPDWIYKQVELGSDLKLWSDMTTEENGKARKMILVALWCIQIAPSDRPTMSKVIEMLEGSLDALPVPPKPTFFSPRSPERLHVESTIESSTTSVL